MERLQALAGLVVFVFLCWLVSSNRKAITWRPVLWGLGLSLAFAAAVLLPDIGQGVFDAIDVGVKKLVSFSEAGSNFVFQSIERHALTTFGLDGQPVETIIVGQISPPMKTIAFWVLPTVIFFSAMIAVLYHYGIMQRVVGLFARIMNRTMGISGAESLANAANIFVGQTEAPLIVKPYVAKMTTSELFSVMVNGFANTAGGVMAVYVAVVPVVGIAGHLVTATLLSAPMAVAVAKLLIPETQVPATLGRVQVPIEKLDVNGIDALARGTTEGLTLFLNIVAMLLVFFAVVTMLNAIISGIGGLFGADISLQLILGYLFAPFALLMGIPPDESVRVGMLLGEKITLTELIAYLDLGKLQQGADALSERSATITSYALCGFANFASIGIQLGGIGAMAPERRGDLARLGLKAMLAGTVVGMMCGAVAGLYV